LDQIAGFQLWRIENDLHTRATKLIDITDVNVLVLYEEDPRSVPLAERSKSYRAYHGLEGGAVNIFSNQLLVDFSD
jgi:hypothetical protein